VILQHHFADLESPIVVTIHLKIERIGELFEELSQKIVVWFLVELKLLAIV